MEVKKLRSKDVGFVSLTRIKNVARSLKLNGIENRTKNILFVTVMFFIAICISSCKSEPIPEPIQELERFICEENGKWGLLNIETNEIIIDCKYDVIGSFYEGLAVVGLVEFAGTKYGFIDKTGKVVIPIIYNDISHFREGLARVQIGEDDKFGFIDKTGNVVIPLIYYRADSFEDGKAYVRLNGEWFFINTKGERVE